MSARSPRGSLSGASSAEVADDFGESLKDLQINNRYEISNLTVIAKENTEHAQAISKALENHIKTTAPTRKLPALYLLDSIVKNVGTPYTVYLGRNLFSTFMEAYTLVDSATRRNMEGMLKTWKEPVTGSMDPRPVFPEETWRPIQNALIKAKTAAVQNTRPVQAQLQPQPDYRNTPTPPNYNNRFAVPPSQAIPQPFFNQQQVPPSSVQRVSPDISANPFQPSPHPPSGHPHPQPTFTQQHLYQYPTPDSRPVNDVSEIKRDVATLVAQRQAQFAADPYNQALQGQLKALLDLQNYLNDKSYVDPASLQQIRDRVSGLAISGAAHPKPTPQPQTQTPQWQPPVSTSQSQSIFPGLQAPHTQTPSVQLQSTPPFFAPGALDSLQSLLANGPKPGTPQMRAAAPALQNASHTQLNNIQNQAATASAFNGADLIASLTKNGLLPQAQQAQPTPSNGPIPNVAPRPGQQSTAALLQSLQGFLPATASQTATPTLTPAQLPIAANTGKPRIPMTSASLKIFRPELVSALYEAQPNQCSTCGRRFQATDEGRAKKDRHLDWHFRTNQRIADPSINRGAHRDWFLPEIEWIHLKEFDPSTTTAAEQAAALAGGDAGGSSSTSPAKKGGSKKQRPEDQFVRAPPGVTKNTCSICFEQMTSVYDAELQDWVFRNATVHEGKIVHATCLADMQKGSGAGPGVGGSLAAALASVGANGQQHRRRSATPDSSLGKRKAEGALAGVGSRLRIE